MIQRSSRLLYFDSEKYESDLNKALAAEIKEIRRDLKIEILRKLDSINFKDNMVRLADGSYTDDRERKAALIGSILEGDLKANKKRILASVSAMRNDFANSHIGWYYEYGTGTEQKEPYPIDGVEGTPRNKEKAPGVGTAIVTRTRFRDGGIWTDLGGNMRLSKARRAGVNDQGFMDYIGEETHAHRWFRDSVQAMRIMLKKRLAQRIKTVPVARYMSIKPVYVIGGKNR
ncbi:hypothetical protein [Paenibacillus xylanexedens]|uniref:hypothetical protein n=1 Tax=Paenibacillus xylanexedens TaxID=528191 RepID=UPI0011AA18FF|nr:hypothetical protein [Paenibacillus xylanexedens]